MTRAKSKACFICGELPPENPTWCCESGGRSALRGKISFLEMDNAALRNVLHRILPFLDFAAVDYEDGGTEHSARDLAALARATLGSAPAPRPSEAPAPPCPRCGGNGWVEVTVTGTEYDPDGNPVPVPELGQERCEDCGGTGRAPAPELEP
jgi:hypothetical protein